MNDVPFGNRRGGVVRPLAMNVRPEAAQHGGNGIRAEQQDGINPTNGGNQEGAVAAGRYRAAGTTQTAGGAIIVDRYDEKVAQATGCVEIPQMPDMQEIEDSIRQNDPHAGPPAAQGGDASRHCREGFDPGNEGCAAVHEDVTRRSRSGSVRTASHNSSRLRQAVPRFMTTMPPA